MCPEPSPRPLKSLPKQTQQPARNVRSKSVAAALAFKVDYGASFDDESPVDDVDSNGLIIQDSDHPRILRSEAPPSPLPQPRKPDDSHSRSNYSHADLDRSIQEDLEFLGNIVKAER